MFAMRWDSLFEGLESLWSGESEAARIDDERDRVRMSRATTEAREVLWARAAAENGLVVRTAADDYRIHPARVGLDWIDGVVCGSATRMVIPLASIRSWSPLGACACTRVPCHSVPLLEFGSVLRFLERKAVNVCIYAEKAAVRGRIRAVWSSAISVNSTTEHDIMLSTIDAITYP